MSGADRSGTGYDDATEEETSDNRVSVKATVMSVLGGLSLYGLIKTVSGKETAEMLAGEESGLLTHPVKFIEDVIADWVWTTLVRPVVVAVFDAGYAVIDGIVIIAFGGDYRLGLPGDTQVGLLDVPFLVMSPIGGGFLGIGESISSGIESFNQPLVDAVASFGIFAPFVGPLFILVEIAIVVYTMYIVVVAVDIPLLRVVPLIKTALAPLRRLIEKLLGR